MPRLDNIATLLYKHSFPPVPGNDSAVLTMRQRSKSCKRAISNAVYLSFLQRGLEFRFLLLNLLLDFLQLMNGLASLCNLLCEVTNLLCESKGQRHGQARSRTGRALPHQGDGHLCRHAGTDPCGAVGSGGQWERPARSRGPGTYAASSCSHASAFPGGPGTPRRHSSS